MDTSTKPKPSWKKLKKKLKEKSEADGAFQDGEYTDEAYDPDYCPEPEED